MKPQKENKEFVDLINEIKDLVSNAKSKIKKEINSQLLITYWQIGRIISEKENNESLTSRQLILNLSKELSRELGRGFSRSNLFNMRMFYRRYKSVQTVSGHLSWSHICELLTIEDKDKRSFYEKEAENSKWSVRELKRQLNSSLFERLLLSKGEINKKEVLKLYL